MAPMMYLTFTLLKVISSRYDRASQSHGKFAILTIIDWLNQNDKSPALFNQLAMLQL